MFPKIFRIFSILLIPLFIASSAIFMFAGNIDAVQSESSDNNSLGIIIEESNDDIGDSEISAAPDLGDDQAFPFIPGFGKNSGKD